MSEPVKPTYELAFHISANLEEAEAQKTRQDLEKTVTSNGGVISFARDLEKMRLAYKIDHQTNSYFGYLNFEVESPEEALVKIRDEVRRNSNVLRFLILKNEVEPKTEKEDLVRRLASAEKRRARTTKAAEKPGAPKVEAPKIEEKVIEEKLEEIIGKL